MNKKILIVDDDETVRSLYVDVFGKADFDVVEAVDGLDGLDKAMEIKPDVIFTGIIMPRMDGFALVQELSKNVVTSKIPVIVNSHMGREEDRQKFFELGAKDFVIRGFDTPHQVVERIKNILVSATYKVAIDFAALDAPQLLSDFSWADKVNCPNCQEKLVLELKADPKSSSFLARFVCPKCGK